MKKLLALILAALLSFTACGGEEKTSKTEESVGDYGLTELATGAGLPGDSIFSTLSDEDKAALEKHAALQGIKISYKDNGSTVLEYDTDGAQRKTIVQYKDGTVALTEGNGGTGALNSTWPQNAYTALLPTPEFEVVAVMELNGKYTVNFGAVTVADMALYARKVKEAGFALEATEEKLDGVYKYQAKNEKGDVVELFAAGTGSVKITPVKK